MTGIKPMAQDVLDMWVVYRKPKDFPDNYVARRWVAEEGYATPCADDFVLASTADELRAQLLNAGRIRIERMPGDDPVIMEVWL